MHLQKSPSTLLGLWFSLLPVIITTVNAYQFYDQSGFNVNGPGDQTTDRFARAARTPLVHNNYSFPGFNFSVIPDPHAAYQDVRLDANWTLDLNYSAVDVTNLVYPDGSNNTQLVSQVTFSFAFPDSDPVPMHNNTNWTLCGYFLQGAFPSNITSRFASETGDCNATLGSACLSTYQQAFSRSLPSPGAACPSPPSWNDIPECTSSVGQYPGLLYNELTNRSGVPYGLASDESIYYQSSKNYNESEIPGYVNEYTNLMRMAIFSFQVSPMERADVGGVFRRDTQFVCGTARVDPQYGNSAELAVAVRGVMRTVVGIAVLTAVLAELF